ncbi:MAG: TIGR03987 family protein [Candidatus Zixiibacteriota bacterium]|nr:MAG: TIGR03987 family protein [candidate division Zixibacteria bacterium]
MSTLLALSSLHITLALVFYSVGVWSERIVRRLKIWHLAFFWLGLCCDYVGTEMMAQLAGGFQFTTHGFTGAAAIALMALHAVWATVVLVRRNEAAIHHFHRFSLAVWSLWLIPYFSGLWLGMRG